MLDIMLKHRISIREIRQQTRLNAEQMGCKTNIGSYKSSSGDLGQINATEEDHTTLHIGQMIFNASSLTGCKMSKLELDE